MEHDIPSTERISREVLLAVSKAERTRCQSLPALSEVVKLDALNELFASIDGTDGGGRASFVFSDSLVSIDYGDCIHVEPKGDQYDLGSKSNRASSLKTAIDREWLEG